MVKTDFILNRKAVVLNPLWPPVAIATIEHLDVDKMQMRIAMATLRRLFMQSQDWTTCLHLDFPTTCLHLDFPTVRALVMTFGISL